MRILVALTVVVVFAAMWVFDTAALLRLAAFCVTGGCGVSPIWLAIAGGVLVLAAVVLLRRPRPVAKATRKRRSQPARGKLKPAKQAVR